MPHRLLPPEPSSLFLAHLSFLHSVSFSDLGFERNPSIDMGQRPLGDLLWNLPVHVPNSDLVRNAKASVKENVTGLWCLWQSTNIQMSSQIQSANVCACTDLGGFLHVYTLFGPESEEILDVSCCFYGRAFGWVTVIRTYYESWTSW